MPTKKKVTPKAATKETNKAAVKPAAAAKPAVKAAVSSSKQMVAVANNSREIRKDLLPLYDELQKQRERVALMVHTGYEEIEASELSDWVDLAAASHERELSIILNGNKDEVLMKIDQAIELIATGKYGICANCKQPIAKERLKAIPFTRLCIHCQEKLERYARG